MQSLYKRQSCFSQPPIDKPEVNSCRFSGCQGCRQREWASEGVRADGPLDYEIWHFLIKFVAKKGVFRSFEWVKWILTTFGPPWKNPTLPPWTKSFADGSEAIQTVERFCKVYVRIGPWSDQWKTRKTHALQECLTENLIDIWNTFWNIGLTWNLGSEAEIKHDVVYH